MPFGRDAFVLAIWVYIDLDFGMSSQLSLTLQVHVTSSNSLSMGS